jgi:hypothetical protein
MNPPHTEVGLAVTVKDGTYYAVQIFGARQP